MFFVYFLSGVMFLETSALENYNIENAFQILVNTIFEKQNGPSTIDPLNIEKPPLPSDGESISCTGEAGFPTSPRIFLGKNENEHNCCNK
jgi:hypothetical protein